MLNSKMTRKGKMFSKLRQSVKNLNNQHVKVGHFADQGTHYSGMTYPQLLAFWFIGVEQEGSRGRLRQDVRGQFDFNYFLTKKISRDPLLKLALKKWVMSAPKGNRVSDLLDDVGVILREEYKLTFNVRTGPHMLGSETPLFETGELAEMTAYKTSKSTKAKS